MEGHSNSLVINSCVQWQEYVGLQQLIRGLAPCEFLSISWWSVHGMTSRTEEHQRPVSHL